MGHQSTLEATPQVPQVWETSSAEEIMTHGRIYCATCRVNGKRYVGQTVQVLAKRVKGHLDAVGSGSQLPFHRALRKHGRASFEIRTIAECTSVEALNEAEVHWIKKLGTFGPGGYNCTTGGEGFEVSEETKRRMSLACLGKPRSEAHRQAVSAATKGENNPFYGRKHDPETVERVKKKLRAKFSGKGNPFYGKTHTPEVKAEASARMRGKKMLPQTRKAIAKANKGNQYTKGRKLSVAHREKLSPLTLEGVRYIRCNPDQLSRSQLAEKLGASYNSIRFVQTGRTWKGVE